MSKTLAEVNCDLNELAQYVREHLLWYQQAQNIPGLSKGEIATIEVHFAAAERKILGAAVELHVATGILLNASVRWLAKEESGQDPSKEEVAH